MFFKWIFNFFLLKFFNLKTVLGTGGSAARSTEGATGPHGPTGDRPRAGRRVVHALPRIARGRAPKSAAPGLIDGDGGGLSGAPGRPPRASDRERREGGRAGAHAPDDGGGEQGGRRKTGRGATTATRRGANGGGDEVEGGAGVVTQGRRPTRRGRTESAARAEREERRAPNPGEGGKGRNGGKGGII